MTRFSHAQTPLCQAIPMVDGQDTGSTGHGPLMAAAVKP